MQKTIIIILLIINCCQITNAQNREYIDRLEEILRGSIQEKSITADCTADSAGYRLGRNPLDPRFEIAYFIENRFEANLTADLEIPSVYRQRNRISDLNITKCDSESKLKRQDKLLALSDKYLELVFNMKMEDFILKMAPADSIERYHQAISKALDMGEITMLDYTDLEMILKTMTGTCRKCEHNIENLTREIQTYNRNFIPGHEDFPDFDFQNMSAEDFIGKAYGNSPQREIILTDSMILERELKLARLEWAPKIVVGARLDMDENSNFAPAAIGGISIPLWEHRGNIKHSKAKITAYSLQRESRETALLTELKNLYSSYTAADSMIMEWKDFDISQHAITLHRAYTLRRITASEYYLKFANLISNAYYLFGLMQERAAYAARIAILSSY